ncbi:MAG TPA: UTP--glucose-1-phosphate uridylyltransferase GalU [Bryocella sp.]|nr:UTP--glucose-1-phosphate uridylyltransferase GalU [Bryocella sp.]
MAHQPIRKAVFPAAGLGTRFLPASKAIPKEMIPLVDKPVIQYGVEEAVASGCHDIIIVTSRGKSAIEDHFDIDFELEKALEAKGKTALLDVVRRVAGMAKLSYTRQNEARGLGHAVLMARELVGDEPFAVILPDDIIDSSVPCVKQMIDVYDETGCSVLATQVVEGKAISAYGVLDVKPVEGEWRGRLFEVRDLVEKPKLKDAPSNLAIIGRYVLTPAIFDCLASITPGALGELQLTDGLKALLKKEKIYGFTFEGNRHDAGDKLGFLKATVEFALQREEFREEFRAYLKALGL